MSVCGTTPPRTWGTLADGRCFPGAIGVAAASAISLSTVGGRYLSIEAVDENVAIGFGRTAGEAEAVTVASDYQVAATCVRSFALSPGVDLFFSWIGAANAGSIRYYVSSEL